MRIGILVLLAFNALLDKGTLVGDADAPSIAQFRSSSTAGDRLLRWVKRTVTDTSTYAAKNRASAGLPVGDSAIVVAETDSTVCADLAHRFAVAVSGRDTVNIASVLAVRVGSSHWVVTDYLPIVPQQDVLPDGTKRVDTGAGVMKALTIEQVGGSTIIWNYWYLKPAGAPY